MKKQIDAGLEDIGADVVKLGGYWFEKGVWMLLTNGLQGCFRPQRRFIS